MRRTSAALIPVLLVSGTLVSPPGRAGAMPPPAQPTITNLAGDSYGDGLEAVRASIASPWGVAAGPQGIFVSDNGHHQVRLIRPDGTIQRVAGTTGGFWGDEGPATRARLKAPRGIAIDGAGRLLIADAGNSRIRLVDPASGSITTVAGDGTRRYSGDGGPATQASLGFPFDVTVDRFANIYIADFGNSRIRRVTAAGIMETIAGTGDRERPIDPAVNGLDGVPASTAQVRPTAIVTDASGDIYFADAYGCRIRTIDRATRTIRTIAGDGCGYDGGGGPATAASFGTISDLTFDPQGRLVVADDHNNRIRRLESDGTVTTIVGDGTRGCPAASAPTAGPAGTWPIAVAYDGAGNLHYASKGCGRTYRAGDGTLTPTAGNGTAFSGGPGDPALSINFWLVEAVVWGPDGLPYFSDARGIWKIDDDGTAVLVAGGEDGDADGPALDARFKRIRGLAFDEQGALWIADLGAGKIKRLRAGVVETMAGDPLAPATTVGTDGPALGIRLQEVVDVVTAPGGVVYFNEATEVSGRIRRLQDGRITRLAGPQDGTDEYLAPIGDGGPAIGARFRYLRGLARTDDGDLIVADSEHHRIRRIAPTGTIDTIAGDGGEVSRGDGTIALLASFSSPEDVVIDRDGNMFVTDGTNEDTTPAQYTIRHISPLGMVSRLAGTGSTGGVHNGLAHESQLTNPQALALGPKGLLVADTTGVRLIEPRGSGWPDPPRTIRCDPYFPDVDGDARTTVLSFTANVNQPWVDILDVEVIQSASSLAVTFQLLDLNQRTLAPATVEGNAWAWYYRFKVGTRYKYLAAYSPYTPPGSTTPPGVVFEHGNGTLGRGVTTNNVSRVGAATGTFDMATDRVSISAPLSALGITPGEQVVYHEAIAGRLIDAAFSRYVATDDTTVASGYSTGTTRMFTFGKLCPEDFR